MRTVAILASTIGQYEIVVRGLLERGEIDDPREARYIKRSYDVAGIRPDRILEARPSLANYDGDLRNEIETAAALRMIARRYHIEIEEVWT